MTELVGYALVAGAVNAGVIAGTIWDERHTGSRAGLIRILLFLASIVLGVNARHVLDSDIGVWWWSLLTTALPLILGVWVGSAAVTRFRSRRESSR